MKRAQYGERHRRKATPHGRTVAHTATRGGIKYAALHGDGAPGAQAATKQWQWQRHRTGARGRGLH